MTTNAKQNDDFAVYLGADDSLDRATEWIRSNLKPEDVFSDEDLLAWAESNEIKKIENEKPDLADWCSGGS